MLQWRAIFDFGKHLFKLLANYRKLSGNTFRRLANSRKLSADTLRLLANSRKLSGGSRPKTIGQRLCSDNFEDFFQILGNYRGDFLTGLKLSETLGETF